MFYAYIEDLCISGVDKLLKENSINLHCSVLLPGSKKFYDNLEVMLGFRLLPWFRICWLVLSPMASAVSSLLLRKS